MFRPLEELIHAYFARTWPIATCEMILILRMGASRLPVRVRTQTGHQTPNRLSAHDPVLAFCIETPHPASKDPGASVSDELRQDPGSG
jgi:hypothetical protein